MKHARDQQRELRNDSGEIMRRLDAGGSFLVTRNGVGVGELVPLRRHRFVARDVILDLSTGRASTTSDSART